MSTEREPPRPRIWRRPGFWQRPEVRRYLPVGIGVLSLLLLFLTMAVAPRRSRHFVPPPEETAESESGVVSEAEASMLRAPDRKAPQVAGLARGSAVTILERRGLWCRVRDGSGREGFLLSHSLERETDRAARTKRAETIFKFAPLSGDVAEATPYLLAPFSFAPIWGTADQGASLEVFSVDHAYYAVRLPDNTLGFVASRDVDIVPANPAEPALVPGKGRVVRGIAVSDEGPAAVPPPPPEPGQPAPPPSYPELGSGAAPAAPPAEATPVAAAVLIDRVDPVYPAAAYAARASGTVVLQISIDAQGNVTKVEVKREGLLGMTEAAVAAVSRWRYRPATGTHGPISSIKQVKIEFRPPG